MVLYISSPLFLCDRVPAHAHTQSHAFAPVKVNATKEDAS